MKRQFIQQLILGLVFVITAQGYGQLIGGDGDLPIDGDTPKWYRDADGDGWGNTNIVIESYTQPSGYVYRKGDCNDNNASIYPRNYYRDRDGDSFGTGSRVILCSPTGYATRSGDCNDNDASINPNTAWYLDADLDGFGGTTVKYGCTAPGGGILDGVYLRTRGDCNDNNPAVNPNTVWYRDADGDGWGNKNSTKKQCTKPSGYVSNDDDYNDSTNLITNIAPRNFYRDADADGYGNPNVKTYRSVRPNGYVTNASDCNDSNSALNPNTIWYRDADGDGWGNKNLTKKQCAQPSGYVRNDDDYNDSNNLITNIAPRNFYKDADADTFGNPNVKTYRSVRPNGYVTNAGDCDDANAAINPATTWYLDSDNDGWGTNNPFDVKIQCAKPNGYVLNNQDQDDSNPSVTNLPPNYYYKDNDGDGWGNPSTRVYTSQRPGGYITTGNDCNDNDANINPNTRWYADEDGDGFGDNDKVKMQCTKPDGFINHVLNNNDCNDSNLLINPNTIWYRDADNDGWGDKNVTKKQCGQPTGYVLNDDDYNDSNNLITNIAPRNFYKDADADTFGDPNIKTYRSVQPNGYVTNASDCNDNNAAINPNTKWYADADADGWGNKNSTKTQCAQPSGYVLNDDDYDDGNSLITNIAPRNFYKDADADTFGNPNIKTYRSVQPNGYVTNASDCDDTNAAINPATTWYLDSDNDGWGTNNPFDVKIQCAKPNGYVLNNEDQDDTNPSVTNLPPNYYYKDNDGDGWGNPSTRVYTSQRPGGYITTGNDCNDDDPNINPNTRWYADEDGDGFGDKDKVKMQCTKPDGFLVYVLNNSDYDDSTILITNIAPRNFYKDEDGDGYGNPNISVYRSEAPSGYVDNGDDYDDTSTIITNIAPRNFYRDLDGDGYGNPNIKVYQSVAPTGYVSASNDCNDNNASINPNTKWYADADGDGFGNNNQVKTQCTQPNGYVLDNTDNCPNTAGNQQGCPTPSEGTDLSNENYIYTQTFQVPVNSVAQVQNTDDVIENVTYFDGLGRPIQQNAIRATPAQKDLVTHLEYDNYGRQNKQYLPFQANGTNGSYRQVNIQNDINSYYKTNYADDFDGVAISNVNAYSESLFEPSPLNRVIKQGGPGKDWKINTTSDTDHTMKFDWASNTTNEAVYFTVVFANPANISAPSLKQEGFYASNQLHVTITKDENWKPGQTHPNDYTTKEYKDKQGRVVLKRSYDQGEAHDTYYVYDDFDNLTYVVPPKVNVTDGVSASELAELCYQYKYDHRNRLIEKQIPGKGLECIVYNKLDQPILTQDANLKAKKHWLLTKYDAFGRVAYTGLVSDGSTRKIIQNRANASTAPQFETKQDSPISIARTDVYYSKDVYPTRGILKIYTINYYDDYNLDIAGLNNPGTVFGQAISNRTRSLPTATKVRVLDTNDWITTVTYYDQKGRPIHVASKNEYLNTTDIIESKLDFAGKIEQTKTTHTKGSNIPIVTIDTFTYDHVNRLLTQTQKINDQDEEQIVTNTYNELGQLIKKNVGGTTTTSGSPAISSLQQVDYNYNVRGWLTQINNPEAILGNDLFAFGIAYNKGDNPLYNGNISSTEWMTANDNIKRSYNYTYDALNRITSGITNMPDMAYSLKDVTYDKMGNITSLHRRGAQIQGSNAAVDIDILSYTYDQGNKLQSVTDTTPISYGGFRDGTNTDNDYIYDPNGNMIIDQNKGITDISYNHLNMPKNISISNSTGNGTIGYVYDASGVKLKKIVTEGSSVTNVEYAGNFVYENSALKQISHPEGYLEVNSSEGFQYVYQLKDVWRNIRITYVADNNDGTITPTEIRREQNYYPFGLEHKGYNNILIGAKNNLKTYQNQEFTEDLGLNTHEWKYRISDPTTGRFWQIDPLAEDYNYNATYAFQENKMGIGIELEGLEAQKHPFLTGKNILNIADRMANNPNLKSTGKPIITYGIGIDESISGSFGIPGLLGGKVEGTLLEANLEFQVTTSKSGLYNFEANGGVGKFSGEFDVLGDRNKAEFTAGKFNASFNPTTEDFTTDANLFSLESTPSTAESFLDNLDIKISGGPAYIKLHLSEMARGLNDFGELMKIYIQIKVEEHFGPALHLINFNGNNYEE